MENRKIIGFTSGCYDLFHRGHVNLLRQAREHCDYLIVGVNDDDLMYDYKNKPPIIDEESRKIVVESCRYVDECHIIHHRDRLKLFEEYKFDILFVGDDWKNTVVWNDIEHKLNGKCKIEYLKHTEGVSSTSIRNQLRNSN